MTRCGGYSRDRLNELATPRGGKPFDTSSGGGGEGALSPAAYYNGLAHRPVRPAPSRKNEESAEAQHAREQQRFQRTANVYRRHEHLSCHHHQASLVAAAQSVSESKDLDLQHKRPSSHQQMRGQYNPIVGAWEVPPLDQRFRDVDGLERSKTHTAYRKVPGVDPFGHADFPDALPVAEQVREAQANPRKAPAVSFPCGEDELLSRGKRRDDVQSAASCDPILGHVYTDRCHRPESAGVRKLGVYKNMLSSGMAQGW